METKEFANIPKEKFQFTNNSGIHHDKKLETKPVGYLQDAFRRFCKNKGSVVAACIILFLVLFAIIGPFCTQYSVRYDDTYFRCTLPRSGLFAKTNFWDGCQKKEDNEVTFIYYYAMGEETGHNAVKNQKFKEEDGIYTYRQDSYHKTGVIYVYPSLEEFANIQKYQNETGRQVIYPIVDLGDRPKAAQDYTDANFYYETKTVAGKTQPVLDKDGHVQPVYWEYSINDEEEVEEVPEYNSLRIEGKDGFKQGGETYYYAYARYTSNGVEIRVNYYEYYIYNHTYVLKDGIKSPNFLFGTTSYGQDILTCLASGARFSFIFAIAVALVNMVVGAIYGAIEGYYGGKTDLVMDRIADILGAIPTMIVISLLKYYISGSGAGILILFIAFFLTGWIGMAGSTRMQFYRFKNQEYVLAARTLGARDRRIMWKHVFPNAIGTLITGSALAIPSMIYSETNLTYLGIINLSTSNITSVGTLIANGQSYLTTYPHIAMFPSLFLALLMLCFNLFGNGLRDAFNPSLRGAEG